MFCGIERFDETHSTGKAIQPESALPSAHAADMTAANIPAAEANDCDKNDEGGSNPLHDR